MSTDGNAPDSWQHIGCVTTRLVNEAARKRDEMQAGLNTAANPKEVTQ